jgi:hypothetical protein
VNVCVSPPNTAWGEADSNPAIPTAVEGRTCGGAWARS